MSNTPEPVVIIAKDQILDVPKKNEGITWSKSRENICYLFFKKGVEVWSFDGTIWTSHLTLLTLYANKLDFVFFIRIYNGNADPDPGAN